MNIDLHSFYRLAFQKLHIINNNIQKHFTEIADTIVTICVFCQILISNLITSHNKKHQYLKWICMDKTKENDIFNVFL